MLLIVHKGFYDLAMWWSFKNYCLYIYEI